MIEPQLHWTDHYVKYGFAVVKGALEPDFIAQAIEQIKQNVGTQLPMSQWDASTVPTCHRPVATLAEHDVLDGVFDQPGVRHIIDTMFGDPDAWDRRRDYQVFLTSYDPQAHARVSPVGHIDFVKCPIPALGSGFMFQASLVDTEPFSGNISINPGTHKTIQKYIIDDPDWRYPTDFDQEAAWPEPYEFVAQAGDVLLFHHLVLHAGNVNHAAGRSPRLGLHCQATREQWLAQVDPDAPDLSPWERSLAVNGPFTPHADERALREKHARGAA